MKAFFLLLILGTSQAWSQTMPRYEDYYGRYTLLGPEKLINYSLVLGENDELVLTKKRLSENVICDRGIWYFHSDPGTIALTAYCSDEKHVTMFIPVNDLTIQNLKRGVLKSVMFKIHGDGDGENVLMRIKKMK